MILKTGRLIPMIKVTVWYEQTQELGAAGVVIRRRRSREDD